MPRTATATRLELHTRDGTRIDAQLDLIPGDARLAENNLEKAIDGRTTLAWLEHTEPAWDAQAPDYKYGEAQYLDELGRVHLAGDLLVTETTTDENGNKQTTTHPYSAGTQQPYPRRDVETLTQAGKAERALRYASWIAGSLEEHAKGRLTDDTLMRIHARAREYARTEGAHALLDRALAALGITPCA